MHMFKKGQMKIWTDLHGGGVKGEIQLTHKQFELYAA
jgi:hypothetical protein